MAAVQLDK